MKNQDFCYSALVCLPMFSVVCIANAANESFGDPFEKGKLQNPNWKWQNEPPDWDIGDTREDYLYIDSETNRNIWASGNTEAALEWISEHAPALLSRSP